MRTPRVERALRRIAAWTAALVVLLSLGTVRAEPIIEANVPDAAITRWRAQSSRFVRVFFPEGAESLAATAIRYADEAAVDISTRLATPIGDRPTWFVFPSYRSLTRSNVPADDLEEGLRPWTPLLKHRTIIVFEGIETGLRADVRHAMAHAIQTETLYPSPFRQTLTSGLSFRAPDWFLEGTALYFAGAPESQDEMILRGASLDNRLLTLEELHDFNSVDDVALAYMEAYSAVSFLTETHGEAILGELLKGFARGGTTNEVLEAALDLDLRTLNKQWQRAVKKRYWPLLRSKSSPESLALALDPDRLGEVSDLAWSPSGEVLACVVRTFRRSEIRLISAKDGSTLRVVASFGANGDESLERRGRAIAWSPDGDTIVFAAYDRNRARLVVVDVITGERTRRLDLPFDEALSPSFFPDGNRVVFVAVSRDRADLYTADLAAGRLAQITDDAAFDAEPSVSASGARVLYVSERGGRMRLIERDLSTGEYQLRFNGAAGVRMPAWTGSEDGFIFIADWNGTRDVYASNADGSRVTRLTDFTVGADTPSVSLDGKRLAFTAQRQSRESAFVLALGESKAEAVMPPEAEALDFDFPRIVANRPERLPREFLWDDVRLRFRTDADGVFRGTAGSAFASWTGDTRLRVDVDAASRGLPGVAVSVERIGGAWSARLNGASQSVYHRSADGSLDSARETSVSARVGYPVSRAMRVSISAGVARSPLRYRFETVPANLPPDDPNMIVVAEAVAARDTALESASFGALTGVRARLGVTRSDGRGFGATTISFDGRRYFRLGMRSVLATRLYGAASLGATPERLTLGGHTTLRASDYEAFHGSRVGFASVEMRLPLLDELRLGWPFRFGLTALRGVAFVESGTVWSASRPYRLSERVKGKRRLVDLSLQYGVGLRLRLKGAPIRLDFARDDDLRSTAEWRTLLRLGEDY